MNSLELNKVFAAVLTAGITFMVAGQVGKLLVHGEKPHESAILIGDPSGGAPAGGAPAAPAGPEPISGLLASADADAGQQIAARNCGACHSFNQGGKAGIGPNLYGIIGAPHGHMEGFNYSAAIKGKAGPWNYDELNAWLYKPATYAPGTRMAYAGLANTQQRANLIAYLRTLSPNPAPLPPAGQPAAAAAPAGGAAPAAAAAAANSSPAAAATPATAELAPIGPLLAAANAENGAALARRTCGVCHTFTEGGRNGVGPNLYDVVGKPHGHLDNFNYSAALKAKTGPWNYEELNHWLYKPSTYAPGTRMVLAGVPKPEDRADIIAYLRSLSASPQPLP